MDMRALSYRRRKLIASSGAMFLCAGFALIPLIGSSTPAPNIIAPKTTGTLLGDAGVPRGELRLRADPFSRVLPIAPQARMFRPVLVKKKQDLRIVAIAFGTRPHALVSLPEGSTQIVGVGDAIEGTRVLSILANAVVLFDGRHLSFTERSQR